MFLKAAGMEGSLDAAKERDSFIINRMNKRKTVQFV